MKPTLFIACSALAVLTSCATQENACEDVTLAKEQIQECQALQKQIVKAKDRPLIRTELERRYQNDCVEMRYYRDEMQEAKCGNKQQLEQIKKNGIKEKD